MDCLDWILARLSTDVPSPPYPPQVGISRSGLRRVKYDDYPPHY